MATQTSTCKANGGASTCSVTPRTGVTVLAGTPQTQRDTASAYIARAAVLLGQVFERFYRRPGGGSGLGLTTVREIAWRHAARVWLENRPDGGLAASLWLRNTPPVGTPVTAPTPTC